MAKIKQGIITFVHLFTGMRKLIVFFSVTGIALALLYLDKVSGTSSLITIKEIGVAYIGANLLTKCVDLGKQWITKRKKK